MVPKKTDLQKKMFFEKTSILYIGTYDYVQHKKTYSIIYNN